MTKILSVVLVLMLFSGCAKQDNSVQTKTIDSLQSIIVDLKAQVSNLNSYIEQETPTSKQSTTSSASNEVGSADEDQITKKGALEAWKAVRNGAILKVKWELKVFIGSQCYLMIDGKKSSRMVAVYDSKVVLHSDDIIVVTGEASGVDEMGDVKLHATNVVNKGVD